MANEVRLIDANALNKRFDERESDDIELYGVRIAECFPADEAKEIVDQMPTIAPESLRPKGRWIDTGESYEDEHCRYNYWACSVCENRIAGRYGLHNYCPNCGAKMEG